MKKSEEYADLLLGNFQLLPTWGDKKPPKYINSPETPIFLKGDLLFNLHQANKEINENKEFLLVEGQLDAIRCSSRRV